MKNFYSFLFISIVVYSTLAQSNFNAQNYPSNPSFEGVIFFSMEMLFDTMYYTYYIKDNMVRMDEFNRCKTCKTPNNYLIFDLHNKTIAAINPQRKMYLYLPVNEYKNNSNDFENFKILKTNNSKKILGYTCYQWRVRNKKENTEIAYWVAKGDFNFFVDFLKLWNRSEKHAQYFLRIPESFGYFPLLSEERTTLREQKMTLRVISIENKILDKGLFQIPKDYKNYEE